LVENIKALKLLDQLTPSVMDRIEKILDNAPTHHPERF
jgi:hypothetical protein